MQTNQNKNGIELLLATQLVLELFDDYKVGGLAKRYGKMFIGELEKATIKHYEHFYKQEPEFITNALNRKAELIKIFSEFNEADAIIAAEFMRKFSDNIEIARKKGTVFFDKLL